MTKYESEVSDYIKSQSVLFPTVEHKYVRKPLKKKTCQDRVVRKDETILCCNPDKKGMFKSQSDCDNCLCPTRGHHHAQEDYVNHEIVKEGVK